MNRRGTYTALPEVSTIRRWGQDTPRHCVSGSGDGKRTALFCRGASAAKACAGATPAESRAIGADSSWLNVLRFTAPGVHPAVLLYRSAAGVFVPADMGRATMPGKRSCNGFCDPLSREGDARPETGREAVPGPKPQQGLGQNPIGRWLVPEGDSKRNIHEM